MISGSYLVSNFIFTSVIVGLIDLGGVVVLDN